jgi:hypothetical protein
MFEGYMIDGTGDEVAGIVISQTGERGYRFHSAARDFDAMDGHVFVTLAAAQRAARDFAKSRARRALGDRLLSGRTLDERASDATVASSAPERYAVRHNDNEDHGNLGF